MIKLKGFYPAIAWGVVILILSIQPGIDLPESWMDLIAMDKVGHAIVYGAFTFLLLRGFKLRANSDFMENSFLIALIISAVYGILLEIVQFAFFPGRFFELYDIIANIIGSFIGLYIFKYFHN